VQSSDATLMPKQLLRSPRGMLQWAQILEPVKSLDPNKPDLWKVDLVTPWNQESYELTQALEVVYTQEFGGNSSPAEHGWPFKMETMDGRETGNIIFTFKRNTINNNGRPVSRPIVVDSARNPWPRGLLIGNGSEGIVAFSPFTWRNNLNRCGISLYLDAVQVLSHVPYESLDAETVFDAVPGGFVAPREEEVFGQAEAPATDAPAQQPVAAHGGYDMTRAIPREQIAAAAAAARPSAPTRPAPTRPTPAPARPPIPSGQSQAWVSGPVSDEGVPF
jgi:hypothetical protein